MNCRILVFTIALTTAATATGADWPGFRGPNRDGICLETGLLQKWPKGGPPKDWTANNLGLGWGAPSVAEGKLFGIGTRNGKDGVWALNEADGKELWFTPLAAFPSGLGGQTNGPASTPTYNQGKLYAVTTSGIVARLDARTGKLEWSKDYVKDFGGTIPRWGYTGSVYVDDDKVICAPGGRGAGVVALKADTGTVIWKADVGQVGGGHGYSSPLKATVGGVPMYVVLLGASSGIVGVHAETGKVLWQYRGTPATGGTAQIPIPIIKDDLVWVSTSYGGGAALLQIVPKSTGEFEVKERKVYKKPELNNHHGGMVLVNGYIYFGHDQNQGYPVCVEFQTGEIKWGPEKRTTAGGSGSAAVLYADGRLYFRYQNGILVLIEPSPDGLKIVSSFSLPAADQRSHPQSWPHPVIANGKLYIRDQTVMHCYNIKAAKN